MNTTKAIEVLRSADVFVNDLTEGLAGEISDVAEAKALELYPELSIAVNTVADRIEEDRIEELEASLEERQELERLKKPTNLYEVQKFEIAERLFKELSLEQLTELETKYLSK